MQTKITKESLTPKREPRKSMSRSEIEATEWARRFKAECPTSYEEAIKLASSVNRVVVGQRDDHGAQGDYLWAIIPDTESDTEFWLDALPTKKEAMAVCREMNWRVRR